MHHHFLFSLSLLAVTINVTVACQSCLMEMSVSSMLGYDAKNKDRGIAARQEIVHSSTLPLGLTGTLRPDLGAQSSAMMFLAVRKLASVAYNNKSRIDASDVTQTTKNRRSVRNKRRWAGGLFIEDNSEIMDDGEISEESLDSKRGEGEEEVMSGSMIMAIGFYKQWISPLLPPACRFLPTCSQYGAQAIKEFGPSKGLILTAWRLARCTPLGGRGYDPPRWPPVSYTHGSY
mmetsp:Transcript_14898/g.35825  ORF Transcript_14898/g.35825 Transcript_14898/m.35825 type:complete len:232 (-) Transcript_14898:25-720(-)